MTVSVNEVPLATITAEIITQATEDLSSSHVVSGLGGSDGGGTTLAIAEGTARIAGYRAITDATVNQVLTDDSVNYVYFSLTTDAEARTTGAEFVDSPSTLSEDTRLLIAEVTCASGAITTIIDQRVYLPITSLDIRDIPVQSADIITSGTLATARIPDLNTSKITAGTLELARIPATLTGKDADTVDSKEPGTTSGKIAYYDGNIRVVDSNKLEGDSKATIQDHTPKPHESRHRSGGADPIDGALPDAAIPNLNTSKITAGELADARIPNLDTSKIDSGTFHLNRFPQYLTGKVAPYLGDVTGYGELNYKANGQTDVAAGTRVRVYTGSIASPAIASLQLMSVGGDSGRVYWELEYDGTNDYLVIYNTGTQTCNVKWVLWYLRVYTP